MHDSLLSILKKLRLSGLAESIDIRLQEAASHQLNHREFLELILQDELAVRGQRLLNRRLKAACFREVKTFDQFDWSFNPAIPKRHVFDLATCRFIRDFRDILFLGPPGVGKSFLVQALGYQALKAGFVVLYRSIFDLVRDFLHDESLAGTDKVLARYLKPDLLIVDDMGMKQLPRRSGECLFEIIMRRYEVRSTIMTSNRPLEDWGKLLGDVPAATAILDRFLHHADIVKITGRSYRLRNAGQLCLEEAAHADADAKPAKAPPGSEGVCGESKPAKAPTGSKPGGGESKPAKAPPGSAEDKKAPESSKKKEPGGSQ
jgi:DNA replication protein DnaC